MSRVRTGIVFADNAKAVKFEGVTTDATEETLLNAALEDEKSHLAGRLKTAFYRYFAQRGPGDADDCAVSYRQTHETMEADARMVMSTVSHSVAFCERRQHHAQHRRSRPSRLLHAGSTAVFSCA